MCFLRAPGRRRKRWHWFHYSDWEKCSFCITAECLEHLLNSRRAGSFSENWSHCVHIPGNSPYCCPSPGSEKETIPKWATVQPGIWERSERKGWWLSGNSVHLRKWEDHLGRDWGCWFIFFIARKYMKQNKTLKMARQKLITGETKKRKVSLWVNLYFLETCPLSLSSMLFAFIFFSSNYSVQSQHKGKPEIRIYITLRMWVISCVMAYGFYGFTCVISFLYLELDLYICCIPQDQLAFFHAPWWTWGEILLQIVWQPSLLISMKVEWFTIMHYLLLL